MEHGTTLIATIALAFAVALLFGVIAARLRLPPIVGYLLAGVAIGIAAPSLASEGGVAAQASEMGVVLLMFGVGLHFSLRDLMAVRGIVVPGALLQIAITGTVGTMPGRWWGLSVGGAHGARPVARRRQHGRGAQGARGARPARLERGAPRRRMARRGRPRDGAGAGAAARRRRAARRHARRRRTPALRRRSRGLDRARDRQRRRVPPPDVRRWAPRRAVAPGARRAARLARAVHAHRARDRARRRDDRVAAVRDVVRARRVRRRRGRQRIGVEPPRGGRRAAAAGCVRGDVLRLGRIAVRPARVRRPPGAGARGARRRAGGQVRWRRSPYCGCSASPAGWRSRSPEASRRSASSRSSSWRSARRSVCSTARRTPSSSGRRWSRSR